MMWKLDIAFKNFCRPHSQDSTLSPWQFTISVGICGSRADDSAEHALAATCDANAAAETRPGVFGTEGGKHAGTSLCAAVEACSIEALGVAGTYTRGNGNGGTPNHGMPGGGTPGVPGGGTPGLGVLGGGTPGLGVQSAEGLPGLVVPAIGCVAGSGGHGENGVAGAAVPGRCDGAPVAGVPAAAGLPSTGIIGGMSGLGVPGA